MLAVLPVIAFASSFLALGNSHRARGWGKTFTRSLVLSGLYLALGTEVLSLLRSITPVGLSLLWLAPAAVAISRLVLQKRGGRQILLPVARLPKGWSDRLLHGISILVAALTGIVALLTPPEIWDSLTYHTARVGIGPRTGALPTTRPASLGGTS